MNFVRDCRLHGGKNKTTIAMCTLGQGAINERISRAVITLFENRGTLWLQLLDNVYIMSKLLYVESSSLLVANNSRYPTPPSPAPSSGNVMDH
jgi:hypothetical protein